MALELETIQNIKLIYALRYAERGWPVIPVHGIINGGCACNKECHTPGKHPKTTHGIKDATTDRDQITEWWTIWPNANIGITTGEKSGFIALDVDGQKGIQSIQGLDIMAGPIIKTGKGYHFLFESPNNPIKSNTDLLPGVDIRGNGGYIVAPPSSHINGKTYSWHPRQGFDTELTPSPEWLLKLIKEKEQNRIVTSEIPEIITEGTRNDTLTSLAGSLRRRGITSKEIFKHLQIFNEDHCRPPLEKAEIKNIAHSIGQYKPSKPFLGQPIKNVSETVIPLEYENAVKLYEDIRGFLEKHIDLVEDAHYDILTAKVFESWLIDKFDEIGYIFFLGPHKSGKTRTLETLAELCYNPLMAGYMTAPSIYRTLDKETATLFLDEAQQYLRDDKATLFAILNAGQRRGMKAIITVRTRDGWDTKPFKVFGSKFIASTEETIKTLTSRCIVISMVKNARRIPLRIDKEEAETLRRQLAKYRSDMAETTLPDLEQTFIDRNLADSRNIEAFINLATVAPKEKRETIITYAKEIDDVIAEDEGLNFYADLYKALEKAVITELKENPALEKISIQAVADAYNDKPDFPEEEHISNNAVGYHLNIMGLRRKTRMTGGKMGRVITKKIMARLKKRYNPFNPDSKDSQETLDGKEINKNSEDLKTLKTFLGVIKEEKTSGQTDPSNIKERVSSYNRNNDIEDSLQGKKSSRSSPLHHAQLNITTSPHKEKAKPSSSEPSETVFSNIFDAAYKILKDGGGEIGITGFEIEMDRRGFKTKNLLKIIGADHRFKVGDLTVALSR